MPHSTKYTYAETLQDCAAQFTKRHKLSDALHTRLLDLSSEIGELCKEYNKITSYGQKPFKLSKEFELEIGDILFSLLVIANSVDSDIEKAFHMVIEKMEKRIKQKGEIGSGN